MENIEINNNFFEESIHKLIGKKQRQLTCQQIYKKFKNSNT